MTLDDILGESRKEDVNSNRHEKYREYKAAKLLSLLFKYKNMKLDDLMFNVAYDGKDIVIKNSSGYHYGRLLGYDGKMFYLDNYHFDRRLTDEVTYIETAMYSPGGRKVAIPADNNLVSVGEIPSCIEEMAYA